MMLCKRIHELALEVEIAVTHLTDCDYASFLVLDHNGNLHPLTPPPMHPMHPMHPSGNQSLGNVSYAVIPPSIKQALQFATVVEFSLPPMDPSMGMGMGDKGDMGDQHDQHDQHQHYLLPGLPLQEALIVPLHTKAYPYAYPYCVLIAGRMGPTPLHKSTLPTLGVLLCYCVACCTH
jgi:hypothetical protein